MRTSDDEAVSLSATSTRHGIVSAGRDLADIFATSAGNITGVTAGTGLSGGGTEGDVTLDIGRGDGITLTNDAIAVDGTVLRKSRVVTSERDGQNKNFKKLSKTTTIVDYSFLVSLDSGSDTADVVVIYKDNLANY